VKVDEDNIKIESNENNNEDSAEIQIVSCLCPSQADYDKDGFLTALDLGSLIDVLFAGKPEEQDEFCPTSRGDFDGDGFPTALDLGGLIDHLFAGGNPPVDICAQKSLKKVVYTDDDLVRMQNLIKQYVGKDVDLKQVYAGLK